MRLERVGLRERPFHKKGRPAKFVYYRSQQEAFKFLGNILTDERGIGLLHGPRSSGKSVLASQFVRNLHTNIAVAVVDGSRLNSTQLLSRILVEFGYDVALNLADELLNMLNVFVVQQTRSRQAPLLILENMQDMYPGALCVLCKLASLAVHNRFALRIVLISDRDVRHIINSPGMSQIAQRMIGDFELEPMSAKETQVYLYAKLQSCGAGRPDDVFSFEDCDRLHLASGGWPGKLDGIAMAVIDQADDLPIRLEVIDHSDLHMDAEAPKLIVSLDGKKLQEIRLDAARSLLGRSDLCDILINDPSVSMQHALMVRDQSRIILIDLKSENGTYVNSCRVQRRILRDNDIISLGNHRIKVNYANSHVPAEIEDPDLADTARMQNIVDARRAKTRKELPFIAIRGLSP